MGVKSFFVRKMLERQAKHLPEGQRELFMGMFEQNPALFEKIAKEVQEKKRGGQDEVLAGVSVMKRYAPEIREAMARVQKGRAS